MRLRQQQKAEWRRRLAYGAITFALAGAIALIAGILVARAEPTARQQCEADLLGHTVSKADRAQELADIKECVCFKEHAQDGEALETPEQQDGYDRCMGKQPRHAALRFQSMQWVFQCNDIRATITWRGRDVWEYDLGGSIIGGSRFVQTRDGLAFNGRPCTLIARWPR
jgi:hypothetical protein